MGTLDRPRAVMSELARRGQVRISGLGQLSYAGSFLRLCNFFDDQFRQMGVSVGAEEHCYPGLLSVETLRRLEFFSSFPQFSTFAACFPNRKTAAAFARRRETPASGAVPARYLLSPAVCYHTYQFLRDGRLPQAPFCVTAVGQCFRFEGAAIRPSPERLWSFRMREVVFFGSAADVERLRRNLMARIRRFVRTVRMEANLEEASDPFFLGASRGKSLLQKLKKLKYELRAPRNGRQGLAIASFNNHEDFFGGRMNIRLADGSIAHSGCAAFGIERWAYAFLCQNGLEPRRWPARVRHLVDGDETR